MICIFAAEPDEGHELRCDLAISFASTGINLIEIGVLKYQDAIKQKETTIKEMLDCAENRSAKFLKYFLVVGTEITIQPVEANKKLRDEA